MIEKLLSHLKTAGLSWLGSLLLCQAALAQSQPPGTGETCAACGTCGGGVFMMFLIPVLINIAILVWVARDAKSRNMDNSLMWMILVMFTSFIGLIIYISSRTKGDLIKCRHCSNNRLGVLAICPHCGKD